jgi:hypothetical protein
MMKKEDSFFNGIEDTLHSYEDAYVPGAWEDFQEKRKRRRMGIWFFRLGSAAAVLLLLSYVVIQFHTKAPVPTQFARTKKMVQQKNNNAIQSPKENSTTDQLIVSQKTDTIQSTYKQVVAKTNNLNNLFKPGVVYQPIVIDKDDTGKKSTTAIIAQNKQVYQPSQRITADDTASGKPVKIDASNGVIAQAPVKRYTGEGTRSVYDSLVNSKTNRQTDIAIKKNDKHLTYSVVVSPAVGNQKFNFGTGLQVSYKIGNNLFINSGVAYSSLNAAAAGNSGTDPYKRTQNVNLEVSGFEVPVGLQYRTKKGFYVSAGVMAMNVMNNHLQYDYLVEGTSSTLLASASSPTVLTPPAVKAVPEQKTEESKEKINNVLGFYILSVGQKKTIGNKKFNFGPFIRVPFGPVSSENIRLLQGGVSLGFDF